MYFDETNNIRPDTTKIDLSRINIKQRNLTVWSIIKKINNSEIEINTENYFQRNGNLWSDAIKSRFIEALIVRQPVPAFYFDATVDKWLIVDGLQRLCAIKEFVVEKKIKLCSLYYLPEEKYLNKTFDKLPRIAQRNIEEFEVVAYLIEPPTPNEVKYRIFQSINLSNLILEKQEIRHALHHNRINSETISPSEYIKQISEIQEFKYLVEKNNISTERMEDRELVLRYLAFRLTPYQNYNPDFDDFLDNSMIKLYDVSNNDQQKYKNDFKEALLCINQIWGETAFTKNMIGSDTKGRFTKSLFEIWTYAISVLSNEQRVKLINNKNLIFEKSKLIINEENFKKVIESNYAYSKNNLIYRFNVIDKFIKKHLQ